MAAEFRNAVTWVWLALMAATLLSWALGVRAPVGEQALATAAVMVIAFVKVRFVGLYFMELRHAPSWLRLAFEAWVVIACAAVLALYGFAPRAA